MSEGAAIMSLSELSVSIVVYVNSREMVERCVGSVLDGESSASVYVVDNSPTDRLGVLFENEHIEYIFVGGNIGYGAGHNIAIRRAIEQGAKYHLVLNSDVYFETGALEKLYCFMQDNPDVGLVMPKILNSDGSLQYLCKLLPTPLDSARRRFLHFSDYSKKKDHLYELRFSGYTSIMDVPCLSGCFMFLRLDALSKAGLFDERFFMYFEDADLCRRIHKYYRTVYYPEVSVFHRYQKASYHSWKLLGYHLLSAVKYFNKWGYFFDKDRQEINRKTLLQLRAKAE
jgi:GT2 family glycosyltransferase